MNTNQLEVGAIVKVYTLKRTAGLWADEVYMKNRRSGGSGPIQSFGRSQVWVTHPHGLAPYWCDELEWVRGPRTLAEMQSSDPDD